MKNKEIKNNLFYLLISTLVYCTSNFINWLISLVFNFDYDDISIFTIIITFINLSILVPYLLYIVKVFKQLKYFKYLQCLITIFILMTPFCGGDIKSIYDNNLLGAVFIPFMLFVLPQDIKSWIEYVKEHIKSRKK